MTMPLLGYFDESEHPDGTRPFAVAGILFSRTGYSAFYREWRTSVLRWNERRFTHFHMTDLYTGKKQYDGVSIADRVEILNRAVASITSYAYASVAAQFDIEEFEEVAPIEWPAKFGSVYTAACHMAVQAAAHGLETWGSRERVRFFFEAGHKVQAQADSALKQMGTTPARRADFRYQDHVFEDKRRTLGLQAADFWAWSVVRTRLHTSRKPLPVNRSLAPFLPAIKRFARWRPDRRIVFDLTGERLEAFLNDQMMATWDRDRYIKVDFGPRKRTLR